MAQLVTANLPLMSMPDDDIYGPVQRAQQFKQQQNALIQQQAAADRQNMLRQYFAQSIDPATGQTNYNRLYGMAPTEFRPDIQQLQSDELARRQELSGKQATEYKSNVDADKQWLANFREQYASGVFDQGTHTAWRNQVVSQKPFLAQFIPEVFDPKTTRQQMLTTADNAMPDVNFQTTGAGVEGIDVRPTSPTFGQTLVKREAPPKSPGVTIQMPGENKFAEKLYEQGAKNLDTSYASAASATRSLSNVDRLLPLVNNPNFISGTLGDVRLTLAKALNLPGAVETQAFFAQMGKETAEIIKAFGSGTSLTDSDREYAAGIGGGSIKLTPDAIRKILFLNQQANRATIINYNNQRRRLAAANPKAPIANVYEEISVPPPPSVNYKGWNLQRDKNGNYAYVSPDGKSFEETQ